ncbi:DNA glycosylase AlkZ-like family protein [Paenibacillus puldeungensis]|uniref:DNA glycosylase AlkZ-like family protein n=1 Tax=Paenibacillus puldeungensis TaxID=696536 RepID=A0ABW3RWA9_9BACL
MKWTQTAVLTERLIRQGLTYPLQDSGDEEAYMELFRRLQPMAPVHFTRPGDPPRLVHRTAYNDTNMSSDLRARHRLIKGRFNGGRIAYVLEEDLKLYATAFRKTPATFKQIHEDIMIAVRESGGLTKEQLKEELSYPAGEIGKALQDLQMAFLLHEEQTDTDWETGWLEFATEWFEVPSDAASKEASLATVVLRFIESMVFATLKQIKSWSGLPVKTISMTLSWLLGEGRLVQAQIDGLGEGFILGMDANLSEQTALNEEIPRVVYMLDKSDFLVRADLDELQSRYKGLEVLQFLLVDGKFQGAVLGHWRIGPYDVDDIIIDLDDAETALRKDEVIAAVRAIYSPEYHRILRYSGSEI